MGGWVGRSVVRSRSPSSTTNPNPRLDRALARQPSPSQQNIRPLRCTPPIGFAPQSHTHSTHAGFQHQLFELSWRNVSRGGTLFTRDSRSSSTRRSKRSCHIPAAADGQSRGCLPLLAVLCVAESWASWTFRGRSMTISVVRVQVPPDSGRDRVVWGTSDVMLWLDGGCCWLIGLL